MKQLQKTPLTPGSVHSPRSLYRLRSQRLRSQRGFTLIEIMIVLIILAILVTVFGGKIFGAGDKAKAQMSRIALAQVAGHLEQYRIMYNRFPSRLESLVRCTDETGTACTPIANQSDLVDGWETPLQYSSDGEGRSYVLKSLGADKREGGEGINSDIPGRQSF